MEDHRRTSKGNFKYPMMEILFLVFSASICGLTEWNDIALFGESQLPWLRKYFPYANGLPSKDTVNRFFNALEPKTFSEYFAKWAKELTENIDGKVVGVDGKAVRSHNKRSEKEASITIVSAFLSDMNLCLGQEATTEKSNEITAIPELLDMLFLRNAIVTTDAMGCQTAIAEKIRKEKKADYVLAVKGNQKSLKEGLEDVFRFSKTRKSTTNPELCGKYLTMRSCEVSDDLSILTNKESWYGIASAAKLTSVRTNRKTGESKEEVRYYISSLKNVEPERIAEIVRSHWAVENKLHWSLDVVYGEDSTVKRKANGIKNYNTISKMALHFIDRLKKLKPRRSQLMSKKSKMLVSLINTSFREEIMGLKI